MSEERIVKLRFHADPNVLVTVRSQVREAASVVGCCSQVTSQLEIAVNEACNNIIQHAYKGDPSGEIVLEILNNGTDIIFRLTDFAKPADPARIKPRDLSDIRPGGLGTHFMREIMDDCSFEQLADGSGNCLEMVKKIE